MSTPVVTVAAGGLPIVDMGTGKLGLPVTEATNGRGIAVTKVVGMPGLPVVFDTIGVGPGPVTNATLDPATVTAVTLSGGNLVATNTGTTSADQGARVATVNAKTSGKYYFEVTFTAGVLGNNIGIGIDTTASTYTGMGSGGTTGIELYKTNTVWSNGSNVATFSGGTWVVSQVAGFAVDLDNRRFWVSTPSGVWNDNVANNPATNVGGLTIPAGTMVPFVTFGGAGGAANNKLTVNFGASAFVRAVPAGFTSGWPTP